MSFIRRHIMPIALATSCLAIGATASAIATAGAATPNTADASHARLCGRPLLRRLVHGDLVVLTRAGFATVKFDRGTVQSVTGPQLTIIEGTRVAIYKTITLTVPANARVWDNHHRASLSDLTTGQRVLVVQGPKRWYVFARTSHG